MVDFGSECVKILPLGAEFMRTDGRTVVAFRNFAKAPKNVTFFTHFL
jgi:hypothetical protein